MTARPGVDVLAAPWLVGVLFAAAFTFRLLSPPFVLVPFFLVIPLHAMLWRGTRETAATRRA